MDILILSSLDDLRDKILGKPLITHSLEQFAKNHNVLIFSKYTKVRALIPKNYLMKTPRLDKALEEFRANKERFILITKLAINNIDYEKLHMYHKNHECPVTMVCRNLVKGKTTPVYKLDSQKNIVGINKKRYASCGVYLIDGTEVFEDMRTLSGYMDEKMEKTQLKAFIHTGYFYRKNPKLGDIQRKIAKRRYLNESVTN